MTNAGRLRRHGVDWVPPDRRKITARFTSALVVAAELHAGQRRKGAGPPYIAHLLGVTAIAFDFGANEDEAIGALLHDAIEDAPPSLGVDGVRHADRASSSASPFSTSWRAAPTATSRRSRPGARGRQRYVTHLASVRLDAAGLGLRQAAQRPLDRARLSRPHDEVWKRFSPEAGKPGTIGYYRGLATAFQRRVLGGTDGFGRLLRELDADVTVLEALAGVQGISPPLP